MSQLLLPLHLSHPDKNDHVSLDTLGTLTALLSQDLDCGDNNRNHGLHTFHSFPAKFPPQLPRKFIQELTHPGDIVLDPMVGSGTTVIEAFLFCVEIPDVFY
jgi:tRNA G10  N-methylase Trm11